MFIAHQVVVGKTRIVEKTTKRVSKFKRALCARCRDWTHIPRRFLRHAQLGLASGRLSTLALVGHNVASCSHIGWKSEASLVNSFIYPCKCCWTSTTSREILDIDTDPNSVLVSVYIYISNSDPLTSVEAFINKTFLDLSPYIGYNGCSWIFIHLCVH